MGNLLWFWRGTKFIRLDSLACVVVADLEARFTDDLDAALAIGFVAVIANERANSSSLATHALERLKTNCLAIKIPAFRLNKFIERCAGVFQAPSGVVGPQPTRCSCI